jgi:hypothetical protein
MDQLYPGGLGSLFVAPCASHCCVGVLARLHRGYSNLCEAMFGKTVPPSLEAGWRASTVALRDEGGDKKGTQSQTRQWKMVACSVGFGPESDSAGKTQ